jgi:hypothetical protein
MTIFARHFREAAMDAGFDLRRERRATMLSIAIAFPVAIPGSSPRRGVSGWGLSR